MSDVLKGFKKFEEEFNKEVYRSVSAEYRRNVGKRTTKTVFAPVDKVFREIMKIIVKNSNKEGAVKFYVGEKIIAKGNTVYITKFEVNKKIEYRFKTKHSKGGNEFHTFLFIFKSTRNGFTRMMYSHGVRIPTTVTGFNGRLGTIKFKMATGKEANSTFDALNKKFRPEAIKDIKKNK